MSGLTNRLCFCNTFYIGLLIKPHIKGRGKGGCENVRPENNFSKNREREITFTEIREREIRK